MMTANQATAAILAFCILAAISLAACIGVVAWQAKQEAHRIVAELEAQ